MKNGKIAGVSLVVMALGFVATMLAERILQPQGMWLSLLGFGFEAGLVGGLADWFAVTALFRHPFGVPIPHTAILPRNRRRITDALVSTVENDLLKKDSIRERVLQLDVTRQALQTTRLWVKGREANALIRQMLGGLSRRLPADTVQSLLREGAGDLAERIRPAGVIRFAAKEALARNADGAALDLLIDKVGEAVAKDSVRDELGRTALHAVRTMEMKGLMKSTLPTIAGMMGERRIGDLIRSFLLSAAASLKREDDAERAALIASMRGMIESLDENEDFVGMIVSLRDEMLSGDELNRLIASGTETISTELARRSNDAEWIEARIMPVLDDLLAKTAQDESFLRKAEEWLDERISSLIDTHHEVIGQLVRDNLDRIDTKNLVGLIEAKVGGDLQWIRVNGAICGFAAGVLIFLVKWGLTLALPR